MKGTEQRSAAMPDRPGADTASETDLAAAGAARPWLRTHHIHIFSVAGFGALWILLAQTLPDEVLPGPIPVFAALWENIASGELFFHTYRTLTRVFLSFGLAMLIGVPIGVAMGLNRRIEAASVIWVMVLLTVPGLVYLILMFMWFGLNEISTILAIRPASSSCCGPVRIAALRSLRRDCRPSSGATHLKAEPWEQIWNSALADGNA